MSHIVSAGLGLIASFVPAAGYTAVVLNKMVLTEGPTSMADVLKLGTAGLLVAVVTTPMISWVLRRLEKVSDALVKAKEDKQSEELKAVKTELDGLKADIKNIHDILMAQK